jgi:Zn-dependent protease
MPGTQGAIRLFRFAGIDVHLHWLWFVAAYWQIQVRRGDYSSIAWNVAEYLALFAIVTLHEFGHSLACRQVGGEAHRIVLWPLGGVAFVSPPQRPGAYLWSIAAGPLVNVVLVPVLWGLHLLAAAQGWGQSLPDAVTLVHWLWRINLGVLIFNVLPVYPLDGGQILRSLLWFVIGRGRSLAAAAWIGLLGALGAGTWLVLRDEPLSLWPVLILAFLWFNSWSGIKQAQALRRVEKLPRRHGLACPSCKARPPIGPLWVCGHCRTAFDIFEARAVCPGCGAAFAAIHCVDCDTAHTLSDWEAFPTLPRAI